MKNFDFKTALLTLTSAAFLAAAAPAAQPILVGDGPGVGGPGTDDDTVDDDDTGSPGGTECPHLGVETVPGKISMVGPLIACDGKFKLTVGVDGIGGNLVWSGVDCPSFLEMIPSYDKAIQKLHYRITHYTWAPRQRFSFECVDGGFWGSDNCKPNGSSSAHPPVKHHYEMPCEVNSGAGF